MAAMTVGAREENHKGKDKVWANGKLWGDFVQWRRALLIYYLFIYYFFFLNSASFGKLPKGQILFLYKLRVFHYWFFRE